MTNKSFNDLGGDGVEINEARIFLTKKEWQKDNCSLSEHKWNGEK